jgi:hypothetical protein
VSMAFRKSLPTVFQYEAILCAGGANRLLGKVMGAGKSVMEHNPSTNVFAYAFFIISSDV